MPQEPKTVLITGASRGIGKELALYYAKSGMNLILIARSNEALNSVVDSCRHYGVTVDMKCIDVCNRKLLRDYVLLQYQKRPIDLIIVNAGISSTLQPNWTPEVEEKMDEVFDINLFGVLNTIQPLIPLMIQQRRGQIVLMSSLAALRGLPQSPSYSASKAAVLIYGQSLRAWLHRYNIKVNVVCPGYIKTDMSDQLIGPKPFLMSAEKAVKIIRKGIEKNKAVIAFPWVLYALTKCAANLPSAVVDRILNRFESVVQSK